MRKVLFVCVENAGRSQMAEAFAKLHGEGKVEASSAGTRPAERVHPVVVEAMRERGIDLSGKRPRMLSLEMVDEADIVATMGCDVEKACPGAFVDDVIDWELEDPKGKPLGRVREIRGEIERRVKELLAAL